MRSFLKLFFIFTLFTGTAAAAGPSQAQDLPLIDAHSQFDHHVAPGEIIKWMDRAGVNHVILSTRGRATPRELLALARNNPGRITPSVRTKGGIYTRNDPKYYKVLKGQLNMDGFGAMAEVIMWHAQKGDKAPQVIVSPDDKRVQTALKAALERKWPFVVHIEFAAAGGDRDSFMAKFETLLRQYPGHPFLLIHMGQLPADEAGRLIEKFPNIHFITSHANPITVNSSNQPWINLFDGEHLRGEWKALMSAHPDRFVLGIDNVWADHWGGKYVRQAAHWRKALGELPPDAAHKVAHGNAERLWRLAPLR